MKKKRHEARIAHESGAARRSAGRNGLGAAAVSWAVVAAGASGAAAADVTYERLSKPEPQNWLMNHHDFGSHRYSALDVINKTNVKNLKLAFAVPLGGSSGNEYVEATPLVEDGFMYVTDVWSVVYKIDVRSGTAGRIVWKMDPGHPEARPQPRRRAVGQHRHLGHRPRRTRDRHRQGNRQGGVGQEPARPARPRDHRGAARREGRHHCRRLRRRQRRAGLDRRARSPQRRRAVEDLRDPRTRGARLRDLEGQEQRLAHRRRCHVRDRVLRSRHQPHLLGHRKSGAALRFRLAARRQPFHRLHRRLQHEGRQDPVALPAHRQRHPRLRHQRLADHHRRQGQRRRPQAGRACRPQRLQLHLRSAQRPIPQGGAVRRKGELDQGPRSQDRQAGRL